MSEQYPDKPILIIDSDKDCIGKVKQILLSYNITNIVTCSDSEIAIEKLNREKFALILLDLFIGNLPCCTLLQKAVYHQPETPVVVISAVENTSSIVDCLKIGACDYLTKPIQEIRLYLTVQNVLLQRMKEQENRKLKQVLIKNNLTYPQAFKCIVTRSQKMQMLFRYMEAIGQSLQPVLLVGETGVGKELFARALHVLSLRKGKFVAVNIAGLDNSMFTDTLFGHIKGAFTGADSQRKGLIEQAAAGTLFFDEIGDLDLDGQVKLLRLLQDNSFFPMGSDLAEQSTSRILVATNVDLEKKKNDGFFRADFYYRLKTHEIHIPPLRERKEDIPLLVDHFIKKSCKILQKKNVHYPQELISLLHTYHFPGNVRELEAMVFNAVIQHTSGILSLSVFNQAIRKEIKNQQTLRKSETCKLIHPQWFSHEQILPTFKETEQVLIREALSRSNGNITQAGHLLGMSRQALANRISRNNIKN